MMNREDVEILKEEWYEHRFWDLENTTGFEEYRDELKAYRLEVESGEAGERLRYMHLSEKHVPQEVLQYDLVMQFTKGGVMAQFKHGDSSQVVAEKLRQFAKQIEQSVTERRLN